VAVDDTASGTAEMAADVFVFALLVAAAVD
jgi:hypothetical protein